MGGILGLFWVGILGLYGGYVGGCIGGIWGLYGDNGKQSGNDYLGLGVLHILCICKVAWGEGGGFLYPQY